MFITKKHLSRRTFLRGAGVTVALPFLESMVPAQTPLKDTAAVPKTRSRWEGAAGLGDVGAPRLRARVLNCYFAINGIHVLFEAGSVFG